MHTPNLMNTNQVVEEDNNNKEDPPKQGHTFRHWGRKKIAVQKVDLQKFREINVCHSFTDMNWFHEIFLFESIFFFTLQCLDLTKYFTFMLFFPYFFPIVQYFWIWICKTLKLWERSAMIYYCSFFVLKIPRASAQNLLTLQKSNSLSNEVFRGLNCANHPTP